LIWLLKSLSCVNDLVPTTEIGEYQQSTHILINIKRISIHTKKKKKKGDKQRIHHHLVWWWPTDGTICIFLFISLAITLIGIVSFYAQMHNNLPKNWKNIDFFSSTNPKQIVIIISEISMHTARAFVAQSDIDRVRRDGDTILYCVSRVAILKYDYDNAQCDCARKPL